MTAVDITCHNMTSDKIVRECMDLEKDIEIPTATKLMTKLITIVVMELPLASPGLLKYVLDGTLFCLFALFSFFYFHK